MGTAWWQTRNCSTFSLRGLVFLLCFISTMAQFANPTYFMDSTTDCYKGGYFLIKNDGVVNVNSHKTSGSLPDIPECTLRFRPEDTRDIIDVQFTQFIISDRDVTLHVNLDGGGSYTLTSGSKQPGQLTSEGGMVTITLRRLSNKEHAYSFAITIRVYKKDDGSPTVDDSRGAVGLVVGLIVGVIVFLVFIAVVGVCCYRRKKEQYLTRAHGRDYKGELAADAISPSDTYGLDNAAQRGMFPPQRDQDAYDDYENNSPRLKRKLLTSPMNDFDYRDRSGSESDSKDPYVPRSFGRSDFDRDAYVIRNYDRSPSKTTSVKYEDENSHREPQRNYSQERFGQRENNSRGENIDQKQNQPSRSPNLSAQYSDPRFRPQEELPRKSDRMRGDYSDADSDSDAPKNRVNKSFNQDPQPPQKAFPKPRSLPVLSNSPKASPRSENNSRNVHPHSVSLSSSETEESAGEKSGIDLYLGEETSALSVSQEKSDTRHTLRPDRSKGKKTPEKKKASPDSVSQEPVNSTDSKPPKSGKDKSKPGKSKKSGGKTEPKQDAPEYEGRFKKAESARKGKSKTPRIGRSRSAGNAFDDTDSIGHGSVSSAGGYRAVPSVTADDYEDSDMESNYHPLRKTGSKTSLYASRSSLYGRRRRKNSIGESVYSYAYDDPDCFDRGGFKERSLSRRHRGFRSVGDLEMELREQKTTSTQTLRETASQTAHRKNSVSSTSGRSKSRDRGNSVSSSSGRPKRAKSESELRRKVREAEEDQERRRPKTPKEKPSPKPKPQPKPKPRKSTTTSMDDDKDSVITGTTGTFDPSSREGLPFAQPVNPVMPVYAPQGYPGYMAGYPPQMPYVQAVPYGAVPGAVVVNPGASGPGVAPNPALSKWDMLCKIADAAKEGENESVA